MSGEAVFNAGIILHISLGQRIFGDIGDFFITLFIQTGRSCAPVQNDDSVFLGDTIFSRWHIPTDQQSPIDDPAG